MEITMNPTPPNVADVAHAFRDNLKARGLILAFLALLDDDSVNDSLIFDDRVALCHNLPEALFKALWFRGQATTLRALLTRSLELWQFEALDEIAYGPIELIP